MKLPINRQAEVGVLGACLDGGLETTLEAGEILPAKCFYHDDVRFVYECFQADASHGRTADMIGIIDRWRAVYPALTFPADLYAPDSLSGRWSLHDRAERVADLFRRRQAMIAAQSLLDGAERLSAPLAEAMAQFDEILDQSQTGAPPIHQGKRLAIDLNADLERRHQLNGALSGIDTGIQGLNNITDGRQLGEVWVIGARPSVGKTALALNIAEHVSLTLGIPSLSVSLEMSSVALTGRLFSARARVSGNSIRRGSFSEPEFKSLATFNAKLASSPFHVLDSPGGINITQLCHSIRAAIKRWGIKVVFIDYLQKIRADSKGEKRTYEIGQTSSMLVELTKRENINLFALAQLNRENEKDKGRPPRLSDLADSKSIEADADFVGLLDRPIDGNETRAHLRVAKQRDGERGLIELEYKGCNCRFSMDSRSWNETE